MALLMTMPQYLKQERPTSANVDTNVTNKTAKISSSLMTNKTSAVTANTTPQRKLTIIKLKLNVFGLQKEFSINMTKVRMEVGNYVMGWYRAVQGAVSAGPDPRSFGGGCGGIGFGLSDGILRYY